MVVLTGAAKRHSHQISFAFSFGPVIRSITGYGAAGRAHHVLSEAGRQRVLPIPSWTR